MPRSFLNHLAWIPICWAAVLAVGASGCAATWDEITSRNRDIKSLFVKPDPMVVLRDSTDGAKRAEAMGALREPLKSGGTQEQQDLYLTLLTKSALQDGDPMCRLGAVRALGKCKDPRGVKILEDVVQQNLPFQPDINSIVRQHALAALEETELPEARHWLIRVARQPNSTGPEQQRLQTLDERLTAIRGLAKFKQYDATETLVYILETEKDVALRDRANQSLQTVTGKRLPPDAVVWKEFLHDPKTDLAKEPSRIQRMVNWVEDKLP